MIQLGGNWQSIQGGTNEPKLQQVVDTFGYATKITLPGVGYVVLNQQTSSIGAVSANMTVIGIHVVVTITTPLADAGTQIYVGYATSSLGGPVRGLLGGVGYGASAHVGGNVIAGEEFPQPMPCLGTHGNTLTNSAASVTIPGVLATGTVTDTAKGTANGKKVSGEVTAAIQNLNLGGMVTATAVKADVTASGNPPSRTPSASRLRYRSATGCTYVERTAVLVRSYSRHSRVIWCDATTDTSGQSSRTRASTACS